MMRRWASSDYFLFLLLFPFPLRLDGRPMVYFCRTKQPTKENSWILAFLVIFVFRHPPPPRIKKKIQNQISTYQQLLASRKVWASVTEVCWVQHCSCSYPVSPACLPPMVQCYNSLVWGLQNQREINKKRAALSCPLRCVSLGPAQVVQLW